MGKYNNVDDDGNCNYDLFTRIVLSILYFTCCSLTASFEIFKVLFIFILISLGIVGVWFLLIVIGLCFK